LTFFFLRCETEKMILLFRKFAADFASNIKCLH
jgi:hypothetical protein